MGILDTNKIITGVKPISLSPTYRNEFFKFNKKKALGEHNYPLTKYTEWKIYGYKKDKLTGIRTPYWISKTLPTGRPLTPKLVGLDGFYTVQPLNQVM